MPSRPCASRRRVAASGAVLLLVVFVWVAILSAQHQYNHRPIALSSSPPREDTVPTLMLRSEEAPTTRASGAGSGVQHAIPTAKPNCEGLTVATQPAGDIPAATPRNPVVPGSYAARSFWTLPHGYGHRSSAAAVKPSPDPQVGHYAVNVSCKSWAWEDDQGRWHEWHPPEVSGGPGKVGADCGSDSCRAVRHGQRRLESATHPAQARYGRSWRAPPSVSVSLQNKLFAVLCCALCRCHCVPGAFEGAVADVQVAGSFGRHVQRPAPRAGASVPRGSHHGPHQHATTLHHVGSNIPQGTLARVQSATRR